MKKCSIKFSLWSCTINHNKWRLMFWIQWWKLFWSKVRNIFQIAVLTSPYSLNCTCSHTFLQKIGILKANKVECRKSFGSDIPMWYIVFGDRIATHSCIHLFSCLKYSWVNLFWMAIYFESIHSIHIWIRNIIYLLFDYIY